MSLRRTYSEESKKEIPSVNIKCKISGTGIKKRYNTTLGEDFIKNAKATVRPIIKFKKLIITHDAGINSKGTLNCLHNPALSTSEVDDSCNDVEKQIHGNMPEIT